MASIDRQAAGSESTPSPGPEGSVELRPAGDAIFRQLVDGVQDYAIFLLTSRGTIASWNAGAQRINGYSANEIIGRHFSVFYTPEAIASGWPAEELRRAIAQGRFEDEGWRVRKDGSRFWSNVIISTLRNRGGEVIGFSKVTRDLTQRRDHEQRVRESERAQRLLIDSVQDYAIFRLDADGIISSWNAGAQRIKGYSASEVIGKHFSIFYTPEARARNWPQEELKRVAALGRYEDEGWRVRKDGSRMWANVVITAIYDEKHQLVGFSKVTRDLTERRRHEEELRERERNFRLLVEGVKDHAMFLLDPAGRVQTWNSGAQRLLGYLAEDAIGRDVFDLYTEQEQVAGKPTAELASARHAGFVQTEGWRRRANGSTFWADVATTRVSDATGQLQGFAMIVRDLTERRRVETLESEGRRVNDFIALLSHELRNPLAPIQNAVAVLGRNPDRSVAAWCAEVIGRQVGHMRRLVDDLLDVSRITSGRIQIHSKELDLNAIVRMAIESMSDAFAAHKQTCESSVPATPTVVLGDATRLNQVVVNLLTNAVKYTPDGGRVSVAVAREGAIAVLRVIDNGIGMSAALLDRVFEPFVQGSRALDRADGGLGLGLTLVKRIVELHRGAVAAASPGEGKGTVMTVTLPLQAESAPAAVDEGGACDAVPHVAKKVLVVDDNRDAADSLAMLVQLAGEEVQIARDGAHAVAAALQFRPDVVLLDIGLPGMNGLEVARQLRRLDLGPGLRIVAVSGYGQDSDVRASADAGCDLHLTKPVDAADLARALG
jgi:PAS domain S-box-containing protein